MFSTSNLINKANFANLGLLNAIGLSKVTTSIPRSLVIKWVKPSVGRTKLNSDGCLKGNPGLSGRGYILRNEKAQMIWAQAVGFGVHSNMMAEGFSYFDANS